MNKNTKHTSTGPEDNDDGVDHAAGDTVTGDGISEREFEGVRGKRPVIEMSLHLIYTQT